jgi:hypothetical protein
MSSLSFPTIRAESKSLRVTRSVVEKPFLVPSKQNIDYSQLFEKKAGAMRGSKATAFLSNFKQTQRHKDRK